MAGISVSLGGNFSKLDELKSKAGTTATSIKSSFKGLEKAIAFTGLAVSATAAFTAIVAGAKHAVAAASDLGEVISKTQAVFKGSAGAMIAWAETASRSFGQSKTQALDAASGFGNLFTAMGIGEDAAAGMSRRMVELGSDLASFNNTSVADALEAIGAGLRGEAEPMRRFGVLMNDATLKAQALASGISDGTTVLDPAQKAMAAYQLILAKTTTAQGDFARTSDGLANSQRTITALVSDMSAEIGQGLLPTVQDLASELKSADFKSIGQGIGDMAEFVIGLASALGKLAANMPGVKILEKVASFAGSKGPALPGIQLPMPGVTIGADGKAVADAPADSGSTSPAQAPAAASGSSGMTKVESGGSSLRDAIVAAQKLAAEKEKSRAAAVEEYNMESQILGAKLRGDSVRLAALQREKAIREEMKTLTDAGFSPEEAKGPATAKVDATQKISDRESSEAERQKIRDTLEGKLEGVRGKIDGQQFQSTIGKTSDMQRVGGGGGAVSSGLDYARQTNDLQREANSYLQQLIELNRPPMD